MQRPGVPVHPEEKSSIDKIARFYSAADLRTLEKDDVYEYFIEVDGFVPRHLHKYLDELPPCPYNTEITGDMLSPQAAHLMKVAGGNPDTYKQKKLVSDLRPRRNYVCHSVNLELYVLLGFKVTKVRKALRMLSRPILKDWVAYNTEKRGECTKAGDEIGRGFYKLMVCFHLSPGRATHLLYFVLSLGEFRLWKSGRRQDQTSSLQNGGSGEGHEVSERPNLHNRGGPGRENSDRISSTGNRSDYPCGNRFGAFCSPEDQ